MPYQLRDSSGLQYYSFNPAHKYYFSIWVNQRTSTDISASVSWGSYTILSQKSNSSTNTWMQHSTVFQGNDMASSSYIITVTCNNYPGNNALMNIDGLMLIDLTESCGEGNEPTKEWCDANLVFTTSSTTATIWAYS